jgi:hypothetical protein
MDANLLLGMVFQKLINYFLYKKVLFSLEKKAIRYFSFL